MTDRKLLMQAFFIYCPCAEMWLLEGALFFLYLLRALSVATLIYNIKEKRASAVLVSQR